MGIVKTRSFRHLLVQFSSPLVQQTVLRVRRQSCCWCDNVASGKSAVLTLALSLGWKSRAINQVWPGAVGTMVWTGEGHGAQPSVGLSGFYSVGFKWALAALPQPDPGFGTDGSSDFWSGAAPALVMCRMGINAESRCSWWVFPLPRSGRGVRITSSHRDMVWTTTAVQ